MDKITRQVRIEHWTQIMNTETGTIQIETKPYDVGMRRSYAFEIKNNNGSFFKTIKESYYKLIEDGIMWNELPF